MSLAQAQILIPTLNGRALLEKHLAGAVEPVGAENVIVVDDGSTDGSAEMLRRDFPEVRVIERKRNGGFSAAVNDGIRATSGEFVVLLNNDVEVAPGYLDPMLPLFEDASVFGVTPRILVPRLGNLDEGAKTLLWHHGMVYAGQREGLSHVTPVICATGCAAIYRRSMLEVLAGFDEAYSPFYWEDVDLSYRAWKRGWKTLYQPASAVIHQHSASTGLLSRSYTEEIKARNAFFFIWRNIADPGLLSRHRKWLPLVLAKRIAMSDRACVKGWLQALKHRREAELARSKDDLNRVWADREIFALTGVDIP